MMNKVVEILNKSKKIGITFHVSPDGDSLGSSLALMLGLKKLGKEVYILSKDVLPEIYTFLPCCDAISASSSDVKEDTDCIAVLDCGNFERISANLNPKSKDYTLMNIDHHLSNDLYGDVNLVNTKASSVGEIIYEILKLMNIELDSNIASCIYTSIVSDTGGFKHSNTTSITHFIASELVSKGIEFNKIHRQLFENKKFARVKLLGKIIDSMYLIHNNQVCIMKLSKNMLDDLGIESSDTSDIISLGIDIDTVEVAALIKETCEGFKISLRSKNKVDVRKIAESFGGGGHIRAAGLTLKQSFNDAEEVIIKAIEKELI